MRYSFIYKDLRPFFVGGFLMSDFASFSDAFCSVNTQLSRLIRAKNDTINFSDWLFYNRDPIAENHIKKISFPCDSSEFNHLHDELYQSNISRIIALYSTLAECGSWLEFAYSPADEISRLSRANFCRLHKLCQMCAVRRGIKNLQVTLPKILHLIHHENLKPYFLTLTIKNHADLKFCYDKISNSFRRLCENGRRSLRGQLHSEFSKVKGSIFSYEVKRGSGSGLWHVHMHGLVLVDSRIDISALRDEWFKITSDSHIINIKPISGFDYSDDSLSLQQLNELMERSSDLDDHNNIPLVKSLVETCKYALKFSSMSYSDRIYAHDVLYKKRLIRTTGKMRGLNLNPDKLTDDLPEKQQHIRLIYNFSRLAGYKLTKVDNMTYGESVAFKECFS
jgi:hypothetical protein